MHLEPILAILARLAPLHLAEPWDNVGLLVGAPAQPVQRVLCCIDLTAAVWAEAQAMAAELVVAYHPPLFKPLLRLAADTPLVQACRQGVALYSPHTALDAAAGGTNDCLAAALGLQASRPLRPAAAPLQDLGAGRLGQLPAARALDALVQDLKAQLGLAHVLLARADGRAGTPVQRVAVCAGAGRGPLDDALALGADLFVTGELPHHDALRAGAAGMHVVACLHSQSERLALAPLAARLRQAAPTLQVELSQRDADPYTIA